MLAGIWGAPILLLQTPLIVCNEVITSQRFRLSQCDSPEELQNWGGGWEREGGDVFHLFHSNIREETEAQRHWGGVSERCNLYSHPAPVIIQRFLS